MKLVTKTMALGAMAALIVSGAVLAFAPSTEVAAADDTPIVTAEDTSADLTTLNLSVNVLCHADDESITLSGVNVTVYTVDITNGEDNATIVIEKVAEGQTDADGNVTFQLPEGEYAVSASYQGLRGFDWVNLTEDQISTLQIHGCDWDRMGPQSLQCNNGSCDCSRDRDRLMDHDMDGKASCCQENSSSEAWSGAGSLWERACGLLK
ncbi:MAG: carboxypeptidase regulatory-like domain-containing protein [Methanomassiliicoccales archaeon]|nr:carboxypeptidase regulatory-like domain-containing protein [Methanomassiliicoccales archaeon]